MFKGIHNEAEFYTNFYFDNKLSNDLQSKVATFADIKDKTDKLKGLESFYWTYRDAKPSNESLLEFYQKLLIVLGYQFDLKAVDTLKETSLSSIAQVHAEERTNLYVFLTNEIEEGTFETAPLTLNIAENPETRELSEVASEFFDELENPPKWILVGSPTTMFLLERNKWAFGKYIKFNWDEIFQQKTDDLFSSILGLISKESLCPASGQSIHAEMDDNSHRHAFEVTTELRESVRESIELLINEMIYQKKEKHQAYLSKDSSLYAKELSHDALFYAYRLIFLLFLEAQAEDSELLPLKSEIYRHGYSLEKLLELIHDIPDEKTADFEGTFVFESLQQIFSLIYNGFNYKVERDLLTDTAITNSGFLLKGIKSDLFSPDVVKHLKDIKLRNGVMLTVLRKLSLSTTGKGKNKRLTRVSYSNLGINQLGAVYEGLLSYSGFFAQEDLHALKPASVKQYDIDNGKELDQIYLAPKSIVDKYTSQKEKKYKLTQDNFVLDENGNPKIYKKGSFVYRLAGRDRQKLASFYTPESLTKCTVKYSLKVLFENKKTLADLWNVKILEPAMGSGAFLNEAVNQIAEKIHELEYPQKIREIEGDRNIDEKKRDEKLKYIRSSKGKQKLLSGIKYKLIANNVFGVDLNPTAIELARFSLWLNCISAGEEPPKFDGRLKVGNSLIGARFKKGPDGVYPWLLLDDGMMNYGKRLKDYEKDVYEEAFAFRKKLLNSKIDTTDVRIHKLQAKADSFLKELCECTDFGKKNSAYERLKLCGDLWCSAFFLKSEDLAHFPSSHEALCKVFENLLENGAIDPELRRLAENKQQNERFFHWEIEFPEIIDGGGFDLILGNPPWLAIEWQDSLYVSDVNPTPVVLELNASQTRSFVDELNDKEVHSLLLNEFVRLEGYSNLLETDFYSKLRGVQKNTYKAFDVLAFSLSAIDGVSGVIQEDGILEDKKAGEFRLELYRKFKYHFQFQNEKLLFSEVGDTKRFSLNIFKNTSTNDISFDHVGNVYLPSTIDACYGDVDGTASIPLIKNENDEWETRGHQKRIVKVSQETVSLFRDFLNDHESTSPVFLNLHSNPLLDVVKKISRSTDTFETYVGQENLIGSAMFDESGAQDSGYIYPKAGYPVDIEGVVLSGPHINTANPLSQETQREYKSKFSYDVIDLEVMPENFYPRTLYQLKITSKEADELFPKLKGKPYRSYFRLVTRGMINPTNERCLFSVIIPPMVSHINGIKGVAVTTGVHLPIIAGLSASLIQDGLLRIKNKSNMFPDDIIKMPVGNNKQFLDSIGRRALALNGLTSYYSKLWESSTDFSLKMDELISGHTLQGFGKKFRKEYSISSQPNREQALIEIDALAALNFGLDSEELVQVYEILFPVLNMYDRKRGFDRKAKLVEAHNFFEKRGW